MRARSTACATAPSSISTRCGSRSASTPSSSAPCGCRSAQNPHDERRRGQLVRALRWRRPVGRGADRLPRRPTATSARVGPQLRRIGEQDRARRSTPARPRAARSRPPASRAVRRRASRRHRCCARCSIPRGRRRRAIAVSACSRLLVDRGGGEPHPIDRRVLVATFADLDAALRAAAAHRRRRVRRPPGSAFTPAASCGSVTASPVPGRRAAGSSPSPRTRARCSSRRPRGRWPAAGTELLDLGEQRFFDLGPGEGVFELPAGRADEHFPPPDTLSRLPHNLPVQTTRFVGRERELATLARLVDGGELITLTGAGGCGKTRLALQLAARLRPSFARRRLVRGARRGCGRRGRGGRGCDDRPPARGRARCLARRSPTRSFATCPTGPRCSCSTTASRCMARARSSSPRLRAGCPGVCVVATTRRPLRIDGEQVLTVPPMLVDDGVRHGLPSDAVQLLLERAGPLPAIRAPTRGRLPTRRASAARSTGSRSRSSSPPPRSRRAGFTASPRRSRR